MPNIPIGLQLFSVRGEVKKDLPATLASVAEIGYVAAEPWGYGGKELEWMGWSPADIRKMYDDNGLTCCGMHLMPGAIVDDELERTIEMNQVLGNNFLIVAADAHRMKAKDTIMELAGELDAAAARLKPLGMATGYHAHGFDFGIIEGRTAWDILFSNTCDDVIMQMDIGNCASGGGDPITNLRKFAGRARSVHLKDYGGAPDSVIGEGQADWPTIFELCETTAGTEVYVVEEGGQEGLGFDISKRSLDALRAMGK